MKPDARLIYGLIAAILLVGAPHAIHLPAWLVVVCLTLLAWRAWIAHQALALPPRWLLLAITVICILAIAVSFRSLFGRDAGIALLVLLAALKLLELKSARDAQILIYLCCFIIITNFFYSQSIPTALFMLFSLLVIMATWIQMQAGNLTLAPRLRMAGVLLLQAIPLSFVMFVLFPRVEGPLWGLPQDAYAKSGLSDTLSPGSISKLSLSDAVAFRVSFEGAAPQREQLYWRGLVLGTFDGFTWKQSKHPVPHPPLLHSPASPVSYSVVLEPHNKRWLFALDMPGRLSLPAEVTSDFQLLSKTPVNSRIRYTATSWLRYQANPQASSTELDQALTLPEGYNPRARRLANEWRNSADNAAAVIRTALAYFNRGGFSYTLEPPALGTNSVDDFLFRTRQGFCEHYAASFVFLMRAAGIPARIVIGYQGGEYNPLGGYYIVRQSDAHAWAEVWLEKQGWVRIDPTAAISPARIQRGLAAALPDNAALPFMVRTPPQWLKNLSMRWDALANQWNLWVLGYNSERQFALLTRLGMEDITWQKMAMNMLAVIALLVGLFTLMMLSRLTVRQRDPVQARWLAVCRRLAKAGLPRAAHEGPLDYAARISAIRPELAAPLQDIALRYVALRYFSSHTPENWQAFRAAVRAFRL